MLSLKRIARLAGLVFLTIGAAQPVIADAATLSQVEDALLGRWTGNLGSQPQKRLLEVFSIKPNGDGFTGEAFFGPAEGRTFPVTLSIAARDDTLAVSFETNSGGTITVANAAAADRLVGTIQPKDGPPGRVVLRSVPVEAAVFAPGAKPSVEDMQAALFGSWLVQVGKQENLRTLEIRDIAATPTGFAGKAIYGLVDQKAAPTPTPLGVSLHNGVVTLDFVNTANARLRARLVSPNRLEGVLTAEKGFSVWTTFKSADEIVAGAKTGAKGDLTVIYISALDCPPCRNFFTAFDSDPARSYRALKKFVEEKGATLRTLDFGSYTNTDDDRIWPADLNWVRGKTYAKGGTPRFLLVSRDTVIVNGSGAGAKLQKIIDLLN